MFYNPFLRLTEYSSSFGARFYRTTCWQKCVDTFVVIFGAQSESFEIESIGLIDYLTLGIFLYIHQTFLESYKHYKQSLQAFLFFVVCFVFDLAGWVLKAASSLALSAICLPIVALFHGASKLFGGTHLYNLALSINGQDKSSRNVAVEPLSLKEFLIKHNKTVDEFNAELQLSTKPLVSHILDKTQSVGSQVWSFFSLRQDSIPEEVSEVASGTKIIMTYVYEEDKPWFSNATFLYFSVMLSAVLPCLAIYSAPSITQSATERLSQVVKGLPKDVFEIEIDPMSVAQQTQLSALFQLNIANVLQTVEAKSSEKEDMLMATERQRLLQL